MIVRLKGGEEIEVDMVPEKKLSAGTLLFGDAYSAQYAAEKATCDRWVNQINRLLK